MRDVVRFLSRLAASARGRLTIAGGLAVLFAAGISWLALRTPSVPFLPRIAPAEWIVYPKPPEATSHPVTNFAARFTRSFATGPLPATALLSVRAMTRCEVALNGVLLEFPDRPGGNWKSSRELNVVNGLRPGTNKIVATVFNATGPPALWFHLQAGEVSLISDEEWEASYAGATWSKARLASTPMKPGAGNPLEGGETTASALAARWPTLLIFVGLSALALVGAHYGWERRPTRMSNGTGWGRLVPTSPTAPESESIWTTRVLIALMVLWGVLFANNLRSLPRSVGFDARLHLDYVQYLLDHKTLPTANEGMEMYNPPLYYGLSAAALALSGLAPSEDAGIVLLRLLTLAMGVTHLWLILASLRLFFPGDARKQVFGMLLAAFLPAHLYLSHYVTNETLMALLVTATLYLSLRILRDRNHSVLRQAGLGACLGAALLTKMSALLAVPLVFGALGARLWMKQERGLRVWARTVGVSALVCLAVCGWHYARSWVRFGTPLVGAWDEKSGFAWWQDDGYRTAGYFMRFGASLVRPFFSGLHGFGDGVYSTLWGDGLWGGAAGFEFRPPWNYDLMAVGYWLALLPMVGILLGAVLLTIRFFRQPSAELFLMAGLPVAFGCALIYMTLRVPCYSQVKAFYGMLALLPICAFAGVGLDTLGQRGRFARVLVAWILATWAITTYASFWIRGSSVGVLLGEGRDRAEARQPLEAAERFAAVLQLDPRNARARKYLTWLLLQNGQATDAEAMARQAIADHPEDADSRIALGLALAAQGRTPEALLPIRQAIELAPENLMAHQKLAGLLAELGRMKESVESCREGLRVAPVDPELHRLLKNAQAPP